MKEHIDKEIIYDCHYCRYATCKNETSWVNCNSDFGFFDHTVEDASEAKECWWFEYCDSFPKY